MPFQDGTPFPLLCRLIGHRWEPFDPGKRVCGRCEDYLSRSIKVKE